MHRASDDLVALSEAIAHIGAATGVGGTADAIAEQARRLAGGDMAIVHMDGREGELEPVGAANWTRGDPRPAVLAFVSTDETHPVWLGRELAVPLIGPVEPDGGGRGLLVVCRRSGDPFAGDDIARVTALARPAIVALQNARLVARLGDERSERESLAAALVDAQEDERRRVAEDIHDGAVQELVGVSLLMDALAGELAGGRPDLHAQAVRSGDSAREAVRALRRAIFDLHPMVLEELGFTAAVRGLAQRLEWQGISVAIAGDAADGLPSALRTVAFRTCQEAIANILRHAEASAVSIESRRVAEGVVVEVSDDGRGFDTRAQESAVDEGHIGLGTLRERAALVGGTLRVDSSRGAGTRVRLTLPAD